MSRLHTTSQFISSTPIRSPAMIQTGSTPREHWTHGPDSLRLLGSLARIGLAGIAASSLSIGIGGGLVGIGMNTPAYSYPVHPLPFPFPHIPGGQRRRQQHYSVGDNNRTGQDRAGPNCLRWPVEMTSDHGSNTHTSHHHICRPQWRRCQAEIGKTESMCSLSTTLFGTRNSLGLLVRSFRGRASPIGLPPHGADQADRDAREPVRVSLIVGEGD